MESLWEQTSEIKSFGQLRGDIKTDVLVIGGGMCGLLCAYLLKTAGVDCVLAEADRICGGITKNTTAKITSQHGLIYHRLMKEFGVGKARRYYNANEAALAKFREICSGIDCDFETKDAYVYSLRDYGKIEKELTALECIGCKAEFSQEVSLPFNVAGAVMFPGQAQFNPLRFAASICDGLPIYEHTRVTELIGTRALTEHGTITAKKIIVATHFPFINTHGLYFLKMYQHRSYVIAIENAPEIDGMYVDEAEKGMSFRNYNDLLLIGGGDHRTGKKGGCWEELRAFARRYFPGANEKYHWATQDCMTLDGVPYIGAYSPKTEGVYVATGFNKWGMTSSMTAAMILTDMILGRKNENAEVFSPSRSILRPKLALNALEAVAGLLTPSSKRCPHLGCALKWNKYEHTWDCSCHGSRFEKDGKLIDNPATGDLKK